MTLKNVEVLPTTEVVENKAKVSLRTRMGSLYAKAGVLTTVAVMGTTANAAEGDLAIKFDFIDVIKNAFTSAIEGIQSVYGIAIMFILAVVVFGMMKGGVRKAG